MLNGCVDRVTRSLVSGWATDTDFPDQPIEVVIKLNGYDLGTAIANRERDDLKGREGFGGAGQHGFIYRFDYPIPLNLIAEITVEFLASRAVLPPGPLKIAAVAEPKSRRGAGTNLPSPAPVLMTTMGRSGGTMVMEKMGANPDIILADVYPYETRILGYYAAAYRALISPADHANSWHPDDLVNSSLRLGFNPYFHAEQEWRYDTPEFMYEFFEVAAPRHLARAFRKLVSDYYERRAAIAGKKKPHYFIEKCGVDDPVRYVSRTLFPDTRELVLLRHPRDVICSQMSFWGNDFHASLMGMATAAEAMMLIKQSNRQDTLFVRYEDIIDTPGTCGDAIAGFLGLASPINFTSEGREAIRAVHATTKSATASKERWRQDLSEAQKSECKRVLGKYEEFFGYSSS
ncbi:sulfotransferase [Nitrospirillum viridazoti]|uniref:Sulfotransferase n=1 Tax=Nitrospirillum viridazoti CBAmc TaxID=1441467 RepID=A0A248K2Y8_9PROT|nr:sulfotransferase [Nitrospirillum amazonense]ASG25091.1 hypothetical protein Y958_29400 [Nitrospirillum amazonense CBAmc]TWB28680.1 sulfotransferase family protein [Nitrospirillum amazonense]